MQSHHAEALEEYLHAYRLQPDEPLVLLSIACTYISQVRRSFQLLAGFQPALVQGRKHSHGARMHPSRCTVHYLNGAQYPCSFICTTHMFYVRVVPWSINIGLTSHHKS